MLNLGDGGDTEKGGELGKLPSEVSEGLSGEPFESRRAASRGMGQHNLPSGNREKGMIGEGSFPGGTQA